MPASGSTPDGDPRLDPGADPRRIGGRYRLTDALGRGAMGTVWAGYDEVLHRPVAVKELRVPPGVPAGEMVAMRERMMREARTLGGLSHPNIITLYDVVDVSGDPYVVLELLPSRNLSEVIAEQGRLSIGQAASVGLAVAAALQAAHRAGITHRDVKPGNVLVAHDGRIKLTDFGIARKRDDLTMTATGLVLGSPAYIAPEVAAGEAVTPAADLWGLGATLFASVEGRPPYDIDGDPVKTVTAVVHDAVPRTTVAGPLAEVVATLMVKPPEQRAALTEIRRRLRPLLADPDDPLFPGSPEAYTLPPTPAVPGAPDTGSSAPAPPETGATDSGARPPSPRTRGHVTGTGGHGAGTSGGGSSGTGATPAGPPAPLAADPGPLPPGWSGPSAAVPGSPPAPSPEPPAGAFGAASYPRGGFSPATHPRPDQSGFRFPIAGYPPAGYPAAYQNPGQPGRPPAPPARPSVARPLPPPAPARRGGLTLVLAGALAVLVGAAGGWVGARVLVGQSPLSTSVISPSAGSTVSALKTHVDNAAVYGPTAMGFTVGVPRDWEEYRLAGEADAVTVLFVSPDGSRELRFDRIRGTRTSPAQPDDFVARLTAARLGVAEVSVQERTANQIRYRTDRVGAQGTSSRVGYVRLIPAGTDLWVVQLTVPADQAGDSSSELFGKLAQGFGP
ncbi:MAG: serine/threonine-protein kinase [Pseudonocardia sp.]